MGEVLHLYNSPGSEFEPCAPARCESYTSDLRFMANFDFAAAVMHFLYYFSELANL